MRIGEDVWISDGSEKEYHCTIEEFQEDSAVLHILYAQESQYELPSRIYLFQGLPKGDKMELIIQKAVELGAYAVVPVETRRKRRRRLPDGSRFPRAQLSSLSVC